IQFTGDSDVAIAILMRHASFCCSLFFFNDTSTTEIYTLSLHDALPISRARFRSRCKASSTTVGSSAPHSSSSSSDQLPLRRIVRSEEHTSELQSPCNLVCRLLLEKKKPILNGLVYFSRSINVLRL